MSPLVTETNLTRAPCLTHLAATPPVGRPLSGQEEAKIDQGMVAAGDVTEVDADLAVVHLAQTTAPLALHSDSG